MDYKVLEFLVKFESVNIGGNAAPADMSVFKWAQTRISKLNFQQYPLLTFPGIREENRIVFYCVSTININMIKVRLIYNFVREAWIQTRLITFLNCRIFQRIK